MTPRLDKNLEEKLVRKILGSKFSVSIACIDDTEMKKLNKTYRGINKTTDILSFNIDKNVGQILISKKESGKKAKEFGVKVKDYMPFILIHGLLHLKGYEHGSIMERHEKSFCKLFGIPIPSFLENERENNSRNRHRDLPSQSSSRGRSSGK